MEGKPRKKPKKKRRKKQEEEVSDSDSQEEIIDDEKSVEKKVEGAHALTDCTHSHATALDSLPCKALYDRSTFL